MNASGPIKKGRKRGRPSSRSPEVERRLLSGLSAGIPLTVICRDEGMPEPRTVRDWEKADAAFSAAIARAREEGEDSLAWECKAIADDGSNDYMDKLNAEGEKVGQTLNIEHIQRSKIRIETRLKLLAKFNPKRWGDKIEIDQRTTVTDLTEEQLDARLAALRQAESDALSAQQG